MPQKKQKYRKSKPVVKRLRSNSGTSQRSIRDALPGHLIMRAKTNPNSLSGQDVLTLQRSMGNRATQQLLGRKPSLGQVGGGVKGLNSTTLSYMDRPAIAQRTKKGLLGGYTLSDAPKARKKKKRSLKLFFKEAGKLIMGLVPKKKRDPSKENLLTGGKGSEDYEDVDPAFSGLGEEAETTNIATAEPEEESSKESQALNKNSERSEKAEMAELEGQNKVLEGAEKAVQIPVSYAEKESDAPVSQERTPLVGTAMEKMSPLDKLKAVKGFKEEVEGVKDNAGAIQEAFKEIKGKTPEVPKETTSTLGKFLKPLTSFAEKVTPIFNIIKAVFSLASSVVSFAKKSKILIAFHTASKNAKIQIDLMAGKIGHPLQYAVKKIFRGTVSRGADVLSKVYDLVASIISMIPQVKPWTDLITAIRDTTTGLVTIGRSIKGFGKWLLGRKGKHRKLAAESIFKTMIDYGEEAHYDLVKKLNKPGKVAVGFASLKHNLMKLVAKVPWPKKLGNKFDEIAKDRGDTLELHDIFKMLPENARERLDENSGLKGKVLENLAEAMKSE